MNTDVQPHGDEEYSMPCAEALLAGTLAVMTAQAQACCADQRALMTAKIVVNLSMLAEHPLLSPPFRTMLWNLRTRWQAQMEGGGPQARAEADRRLWHTSPACMQ